MRAVVRWLTRHVALLGLLALPSTGCGNETNNNTTDATTTSSSTATTGPVAFVAQARAMTFGTKDLAAASDGELLRLGKVVCDGLGIEGLGLPPGRRATGAVRGPPHDHRSHRPCQERGAQPVPSAGQRRPSLTSTG